LGRCVWELRCGITTLGEKLVAASGAADAACFVPGYLAGACRERTDMLVNAPESLACDDLLLVNASVKPEGLSPAPAAGEACLDEDGELAWARFAGPSAPPMRGRSIDGLIEWAKKSPNMRPGRCPRWKYIWQLVLENAGRISDDFKRLGLRGIEGRLERQAVIMGFAADVYVAPGAVVHPMAVIDATGGPVFIDEGAAIHSFTRVEGPCHVGKGSILLGAKCREGTSIGPACRVGGEVEESIIQGYSNK